MTEEIIKAVCKAIYEEFGSEDTLYSEAVEQNMKTPCFFVLCAAPELNRFLGNRYFKKTPVVIQYFPLETAKPKTECENIAERLFLLLDQIPFEDSFINGTDLNAKIVDGVLNFFVDYNMFVHKVKAPKDKMKSLTMTSEVRDDKQ